jgi:S1-C subfamily serine protease
MTRLIAKLSLAIVASVGLTAQAPSGTTMTVAARSVAKVIALECPGSTSRVGSGFVWRDSATVVTARHVVAGCRRVTIYFQSQGKSYTARPDREIRSRDLMTLRLDAASGLAPLRAAIGLPPVNARLEAIGFALGAPTMDSKSLNVTLANQPPGAKLSDMLADDFRRRILQSGELRLDTGILRLDGNLLPGLSGAPLITQSGTVAAIGSGGLLDGAGGVVWAVRADYLTELATAAPATTMAAPAGTSGLTYAYQTQQAAVSTIGCGVGRLQKSGTIAIENLSTDDMLGLQQLSAVTGFWQDPNARRSRFDVWVDAGSGATIVLPERSVIRRTSSTNCEATIGAGIYIEITIAQTDTSSEVANANSRQAISLAFETSPWLYRQYGMLPDQQWTYPSPRFRPDGFGVRRAAYLVPGPPPDYTNVRSDYMFVTHMFRGNRYVGVAAMRRDFFVNPQAPQYCAAQPYDPNCQQEALRYKPWAKAVVATHLATMTPR